MPRPTLVLAAIACGAGLFAAVQYVHARFDRPALAAPVERGDDSPVNAGADSAVTRARDSSSANLALLAARLGSIEQKLGELGPGAGAEPARAEAERAEQALVKPVRAEERTVMQQTAFETATAVVEHALESGTWTDADQKRMEQIKDQLLPGDHFALRGKLSLTANQDKLRDLATQPFFF